jgi:hypothetical protein
MGIKNKKIERINDIKPKKHRVREFAKANLLPSIYTEIAGIRKRKMAGEDVGKSPYLKAVGRYIARIGGSAAIQFSSTSLFGVLAWQTKAGAPTTNSLDNASPVANAFAAAVTSMIPPHHQESAATIAISADYIISAVRVLTEHALWRKYKITPDFPGTMVSPIVIGTLEMGYKTMAFAEMPDSPAMRLAQGIKGLYGNLVRFAMVGAIFVGGKIYDKLSKKPDRTEEKPGEPKAA